MDGGRFAFSFTALIKIFLSFLSRLSKVLDEVAIDLTVKAAVKLVVVIGDDVMCGCFLIMSRLSSA